MHSVFGLLQFTFWSEEESLSVLKWRSYIWMERGGCFKGAHFHLITYLVQRQKVSNNSKSLILVALRICNDLLQLMPICDHEHFLEGVAGNAWSHLLNQDTWFLQKCCFTYVWVVLLLANSHKLFFETCSPFSVIYRRCCAQVPLSPIV